MTLFNRIVGNEEPKIPVHQFQASMVEWVLTDNEPGWDYVTRQDVIDAFGIQADEEAYLDQLYDWFNTASNLVQFSVVFDNVFLCGEQGLYNYDTQARVDQRLEDQSNQ